jgi:hypothetical protein
MDKVGMTTDACNFSHSPYLDTHLTLDHDATPSVGVASPWRRKSNKIKPGKLTYCKGTGCVTDGKLSHMRASAREGRWRGITLLL